MCLAIPGKIKTIDKDQNACVDFDGIKRSVSLKLVPNAKVNDYVLVHAGFAIELVNIEDAKKTQKILDNLVG